MNQSCRAPDRGSHRPIPNPKVSPGMPPKLRSDPCCSPTTAHDDDPSERAGGPAHHTQQPHGNRQMHAELRSGRRSIPIHAPSLAPAWCGVKRAWDLDRVETDGCCGCFSRRTCGIKRAELRPERPPAPIRSIDCSTWDHVCLPPALHPLHHTYDNPLPTHTTNRRAQASFGGWRPDSGGSCCVRGAPGSPGRANSPGTRALGPWRSCPSPPSPPPPHRSTERRVKNGGRQQH